MMTGKPRLPKTFWHNHKIYILFLKSSSQHNVFLNYNRTQLHVYTFHVINFAVTGWIKIQNVYTMTHRTLWEMTSIWLLRNITLYFREKKMQVRREFCLWIMGVMLRNGINWQILTKSSQIIENSLNEINLTILRSS